MSLFEELKENCKVIFDGDAFGYLKADDVNKYLKNRELENHKSKSGDYIQVEINVPVDMIHIVEPFITGEPGDYDTDHEAIEIDDCLFDIRNYEENEINQLAFERWEKE